MTVEKLLAETGHVLAVADFDAIEELDAVADDVAGVSKSERRLLNQPHELCGLLFYPLTVAKSLWYAEKCEEWEVSGTAQESLLFWLLSLPNDSDALDAFSLRKDADKAIRRLSRKLHCTDEEMTAVYYKCLGITQSDATDGGAKDTDYGGMIAVLLCEYGGKPNEWLYETPVQMISTLFSAYSDKVNAQNDAGRSASARGGKAVAPPPSKSLAALSKFREKVNEIRELWSVDHGEE